MKICSKGHEEIVHEFSACPLCELIKQHDYELTEINERIDALKSTVEDLESELINAGIRIDKGA